MARRSSDIALLLGSRGRSRSRGGVTKLLRGVWDSTLGRVGFGSGAWITGRSQWRDERPARGVHVSKLLAVVVLLATFAGGFFAGGKLGAPPRDGLNANGGADQPKKGATEPGWIDTIETLPLARDAFIVAMYPDLADADAMAKAKALCDYLGSQKINKVRPYRYPGKVGPVWVAAVYFANDTERFAASERLLLLPEEVPDESFVFLRKTTEGWPNHRPIK